MKNKCSCGHNKVLHFSADLRGWNECAVTGCGCKAYMQSEEPKRYAADLERKLYDLNASRAFDAEEATLP